MTFEPDDELDVDADESELVDPLDRLLSTEPAPMPAITPEGGFAPQGVGMPDPIPEATPENFVCLRGPCKHYMEAVQLFPAGNPKGVLSHVPQQTTRYCLRMQGPPLDLTDENVYACSEWDPLPASELAAREDRRKAWFGSRKNGGSNGGNGNG